MKNVLKPAFEMLRTLCLGKTAFFSSLALRCVGTPWIQDLTYSTQQFMVFSAQASTLIPTHMQAHTHMHTYTQLHTQLLYFQTLSNVLLVRQSEKIYPEAWPFVLQRIYFHTLPRTEENSAEPTNRLNCTPEPVLFVRLQEGSLLFLCSLKASERQFQ